MSPAGVLIGTHTYAASGDAARRQERALGSLRALRGVSVVNLQFATLPHVVDGVETLPVLEQDSTTVSGRQGPRKPLVSEAFDALCAAASARGLPYFCFTNGDIRFTQGAVDLVLGESLDACVFSRQDVDAGGAPLGMELAGTDVFAVSTRWWASNRRRFRPYIAGEVGWDNVYTAILLCHADAAIENRRPLVLHEAHPPGPRPSPHFGEYVRMLTAFDAGYFTLWCRYWDGLRRMRAAGAAAEEEVAFARAVFVWQPSLVDRAVQAGRSVKARLRYNLSK